MKVINDPIFLSELKDILQNIAKDKQSASHKFKNDLRQKIKQIPDNPFMYRKSIYFNNENIRDMIYKGYTIIYEVNLKNSTLEILSIFNKNKPDKV